MLKNPPEHPIKIGLFADAQYADKMRIGKRFFRKSLEKIQECVTKFNKEDVDFTVNLGDLIDGYYENLEIIILELAKLGNPRYNLLGNHDFNVDDDKKTIIREELGGNRNDRGKNLSYFSFKHHNWRFIFLDGNDISLLAHPLGCKEDQFSKEYYQNLTFKSPGWNGAMGEDQVEWLKLELQNAKDNAEKVIIFSHYPIYPKDVHNLWNSETIIDIIGDNNQVKAYISGHNHGGNYGKLNHVHCITLKAMVDSRRNTFAVLKIHSDHLEIEGYGREKSKKYSF